MVQYVGTANLIRLVDSIGVEAFELLAKAADPRNLFGLLSAPAAGDLASACAAQ
jgi:hypothetical protein